MMKFGWSKNVSCSRRESVYLNLTVEEIRDSLRDYICVVKRYTAFGGGVSYVGGSKNNVSLPSFERPEKKGDRHSRFHWHRGGRLGDASGRSLWCYLVGQTQTRRRHREKQRSNGESLRSKREGKA